MRSILPQMKPTITLITILNAVAVSVGCRDKDPYAEGMHWDYSITCEGGFVYKTLPQNRGTILILNSDGTPLRCGRKRH